VSGKRFEEVLLDEVFRHLAGLPPDEDRDRGLFAPDTHFLLKSIIGCDVNKVKDVWQRAFLELLRNHQRLGIPLSQEMLNRAADELERLWWPKAGRPALVPPKTLRHYVDGFEAIYRQRGDGQPRTTALKGAKEFFGYVSVESVRKAMQPSRHRRPKPT
jgi:hypothetical protein